MSSVDKESPKSLQENQGNSQQITDINKKETMDGAFDKHQRFNFRKLNMAPLNKDHSRGVEGFNKDGVSQVRNQLGSATAGQNRNRGSTVEKSEKHISSKVSDRSEREIEVENLQKEIELATPTHTRNNMTQDMSQGIKEKGTPQGFQSSASNGKNQGSQFSNPANLNPQTQLTSIDQRRARRKQLNLRDNLSPQQLLMNSDFVNGHGSDIDHKTTGRWSKEEHEKFIEAMSMFGRDWKKVEQHIGTRSGAQIRSHAQKFFNRIEKELGADVETYINQKAKAIFERKKNLAQGITITDLDDGEEENKIDELSSQKDQDQLEDTHQMMIDQEDAAIRAEINQSLADADEQENSLANDGDNENSHPAVIQSPRKNQSILEFKGQVRKRERSSSHTFGTEELQTGNQSISQRIAASIAEGSIYNESNLNKSRQNQNLTTQHQSSKSKYHPSKFGLKKNKNKSKKKQIYAFSPQIKAKNPTQDQEIKNNTLQQVLKESFNNYSNPQENSPDIRQPEYQTLEEFFFSFENERRYIYNQIILEFDDSIPSPQKMQIYLELFESLHQKVVDIYTTELQKDQQMPMQLKQRFLSLVIELSNNIQLLQQIRDFQALSAQIDHKLLQTQVIQNVYQKPKQQLSDLNFNLSQKNNVLSAGTLTPTSISNQFIHNMFGGFSQYTHNNPGLNNLAMELINLLQTNQRASTTLNSRKISNDWFDKSHHSHDHNVNTTNLFPGNISLNSNNNCNNNERSFNNLFSQNLLNSLNDAYLSDASKKREIKFNDKLQEQSKKPQQNQNSLFSQISAALGVNQPTATQVPSNTPLANQMGSIIPNSGIQSNNASSFKTKGENEFAMQSLKRLRGLSQNNEQVNDSTKISPERNANNIQQIKHSTFSHQQSFPQNLLQNLAPQPQIQQQLPQVDMQNTINSLFQLFGHPQQQIQLGQIENPEFKLNNILSNMGSANLISGSQNQINLLNNQNNSNNL